MNTTHSVAPHIPHIPVDPQSNIDKHVIEARSRLTIALDASVTQHKQEITEQFIKRKLEIMLENYVGVTERHKAVLDSSQEMKDKRDQSVDYYSKLRDQSVIKKLSLILQGGDFNINKLLITTTHQGDSSTTIQKGRIDAFHSLNPEIRNMIAQIAYVLAMQGKNIYFPNVEEYIHASSVDLLVFPTDLDGVCTAIDRANDRYEQVREKEESDRIQALIQGHYSIYLDTDNSSPTKKLHIVSNIFPTLYNIPWIEITSQNNDVFQCYIRDFIVFQSSCR